MICGYVDSLSIAPGASVSFFVSCDRTEYTARLVRLPGLPDTAMSAALDEDGEPLWAGGTFPGRVQRITPGSGACSARFRRPETDTLIIRCWIQPTTPERPGAQSFLTIEDDDAIVCELGLREGRIAARDRSGHVLVNPATVDARAWVEVELALQGSISLSVRQARREPVVIHQPGSAREWTTAGCSTSRVHIGSVLTDEGPQRCFNGKIARPEIVFGEDRVAWHFGEALDSTCLFSTGSLGVALQTFGGPTRAVTGPNWDGTHMRAQDAPAHYDAIHFHEDDLVDASWTASFTLPIGHRFSSGIYAVHLSTGAEEDYVPFVVVDLPGVASADVVVVLPTWTYLAYANWRAYAEDPVGRSRYFGEVRKPNAVDTLMLEHPELGLCFYDTHSDGSPVCYSSSRRPILNLRPFYEAAHANGARHLTSDLLLLAWLDRESIPYAVVTDDELHEAPQSALGGYRVALTGSHPEYASSQILEAYERFVGAGGRVMYLGGNGFYWVTSRVDHPGSVLEMRRGHNGIRRVDTPPGEEFHSSTGEYGGLWRYRGRSPHGFFGVGMVSQGFDVASGYSRTEGTNIFDWVFDGVVGSDFGMGVGPLGGAAGDEIDCVDASLGTPAGTVVLASSLPHSARYLLVIEDIPHLLPNVSYDGPGNERIRSDVALVPFGGDYRIFSVGSIAWINALGDDAGKDIRTITRNVLDRFLDPDPLKVEA